MRQLEHGIADAKGAWRRALSRSGRTSPDTIQPARLVIRLDSSDLQETQGKGATLSTKPWRDIVVSAVNWLGPTPVTFLAQHAASHPLLEDLIRFSHRLECFTELVIDGTGIDQERAETLIDCGLARVRVLVGGVSDEIQQAVVGNTASDATKAVNCFVAAKRNRQSSLDIEIAIPWQGPVDQEIRAVIGWSRQAGANGFRIVAPWKAENMPADPELLDAIAHEETSFQRTPVATFDEIHAMVANQDGQPGTSAEEGPRRRRRNRCPIGGERLEINSTGQTYACPFKTPIARAENDLRSVWAQAKDHLQEIQSCERRCAHIELAPRPIWQLHP